MEKELLILKRKKAKELHNKGWSNRKIARLLLTNKDSVADWIKLSDEGILIDKRGWKKGIPRKYSIEAKKERGAGYFLRRFISMYATAAIITMAIIPTAA